MSEKVINRARRNKKDFDEELGKLVEEYKIFANKSPKLKVNGIVGVIYSNIFYPLIDEIDGFYYLGGGNIRMVLKSKCKIYDGNKEVVKAYPSDHDIKIGKSPIIPFGCDPTSLRSYPPGLKNFEKKLV